MKRYRELLKTGSLEAPHPFYSRVWFNTRSLAPRSLIGSFIEAVPKYKIFEAVIYNLREKAG
jgi:hypothetical protein